MDKKIDARIENLEMKLAHLELAFDELNEVVYAQAKQLDLTDQRVEQLRGRLKDMTDEAEMRPHSAEDELPPHY
ncbi:MAG: SlyX family protein [Arenicellales bacterium]